MERSEWWEIMEAKKRTSKSTVVVGALGALLASTTFVLGMIVGASNAGTNYENSEPNQNCYSGTDTSGYESADAALSSLISCQVMGMSETAAISFIEGKQRSWRIAARDGEGFALTEDYSETRINLSIYYHIVVGADPW